MSRPPKFLSAHIEFIRRYYSIYTDAALRQRFEEEFGWTLSLEALRKYRQRLGLKKVSKGHSATPL